jgi:hypothetical protein
MIFVETSTLAWNKNAPLTAEIMKYMFDIGFDLMDLLDIARLGKSDLLFQMDFAFAKRGSWLFEKSNKEIGLIMSK